MKTFRPAPQRMIFPSVLCGGLLGLMLWKNGDAGLSAGMLKASVALLGLFALLSFLFMKHRLVFSEQEIISTSLLETLKIDLGKVVVSQLSISKSNPVSLAFYDRIPSDRTKPIAVIPLQMYKKADIAWLLAQPTIKLDH